MRRWRSDKEEEVGGEDKEEGDEMSEEKEGEL